MPGQREERAKAVKFKGKQQRRSGQQSVPARQQAAQQAAFDVVQPGEEEGAKRGNLVDEIEFEQRLKASLCFSLGPVCMPCCVAA